MKFYATSFYLLNYFQSYLIGTLLNGVITLHILRNRLYIINTVERLLVFKYETDSRQSYYFLVITENLN